MGNVVPTDAVYAAAARFAERIVRFDVYDDARARIAADRATGYRIVLATASYDFYVREIASRLGIDDVIATPSTVEGETMLSKIAGENCYGPAKLRMIEAWMAAQGMADARLGG
jgi:phosphoserine phosphatase